MSSGLLGDLSSSDVASTKPSLLYSLNMLNLEFGTFGFGSKDKLQVATLKAVCNQPGLPKKKHVAFIAEALQSDNDRWESILITMDALSNWQKSKITSCKILATILHILQNGPPTRADGDSAVLKILITNILEHWTGTDIFLQEFSLYLHQRISFLEEYPEFNPQFNRNTVSTNGLSLPPNDVDTILPILSRLLSSQAKLMVVMRIPFNIDATELATKDELLTYKCALSLVYEDSFAVHVALTHMLIFIHMNTEHFSTDVTAAFMTQFNELFAGITSARERLRAADVDVELSRLPSKNPVLDSVNHTKGTSK